MARSSRIPAVFCVGVLLVVSACDGPTAPAETALEPPAPAFLIGQSPLIVLDPTVPLVRVMLEVNRGLTEVKIEDKFRAQTTLLGWWEGVSEPGLFIASQTVELTGVKDTGVRQGNTVSIIMDIDIPAPEWDALLGADESATGGENPQLHVLSELILTDGAGKEHVLKTVDVTKTIDPKGNG